MSKGSKQRPVTNQKEFENNWDNIFNKDKENTTVINKLHPQYKVLSDEQKEVITTLHHVRSLIEQAAHVTSGIARTLYPLWYKNEKTLQKMWGFEDNETYIKFWQYPYCACPKMDNNDSYPSGHYYINGNCPIHGEVSG